MHACKCMLDMGRIILDKNKHFPNMRQIGGGKTKINDPHLFLVSFSLFISSKHIYFFHGDRLKPSGRPNSISQRSICLQSTCRGEPAFTSKVISNRKRQEAFKREGYHNFPGSSSNLKCTSTCTYYVLEWLK